MVLIRTRYPGLVVVLFGVSVASAANQKITLNALPAAVVNSVKLRFPDAVLLSATKSTKKGRLVYEVNISIAGFEKNIDVTPEGRITDRGRY